jgi:RNA polymerase sigma factor (sigma-70 family)
MGNTNSKDKEDLALIKKIKSSNCNDSFMKLSSSYENFYFSIAKKYYIPLTKMGMSKEDINVEKDFILYKAIQSFDAKQKTKFSTWFCNCTRYHFLNFINSNKKYVVSEDKTIDFINAQNVLITVDKNSETVDYIDSLLSSMRDNRIKEIFKLRYFSGNEKLTTWNRIAKRLNISTQTAINLHEKARVFLKNKIESKNSFDLI